MRPARRVRRADRSASSRLRPLRAMHGAVRVETFGSAGCTCRCSGAHHVPSDEFVPIATCVCIDTKPARPDAMAAIAPSGGPLRRA